MRVELLSPTPGGWGRVEEGERGTGLGGGDCWMRLVDGEKWGVGMESLGGGVHWRGLVGGGKGGRMSMMERKVSGLVGTIGRR